MIQGGSLSIHKPVPIQPFPAIFVGFQLHTKSCIINMVFKFISDFLGQHGGFKQDAYFCILAHGALIQVERAYEHRFTVNNKGLGMQTGF